MSYLKKMNYLVNEILFQTGIQENIHMQMNLPEYCADISSVLQSFAFVNITSESVLADKILLEGTVLVRVLYLSEGEIFSYEQSAPFSKSVAHSCSAAGAVLDMNTYVQYVNSRASSPRRIDIDGSFLIDVKLSACNEASVIDCIEKEDVEVNKQMLCACSAGGSTSASVTLNQVIDIGSDKPPMKSIIRSTANAIVEQTKQVSGKVLVKGELKIKTLYKSENNTVEYIENALPLSQILDIDEMDEESTLDIKVYLSSIDIAIKPTALGNMSLMDIHAVALMNVCAYNCIDFPVVKDAYSTNYESECTFKNVCVQRIVKNIRQPYMHTFKTDTISDLSKIVDVWCDDVHIQSSYENETLLLTGTLHAYLLYEDLENRLKLNHMQSEFVFEDAIGALEQVKCEPHAVITGCDYMLGENTVELRVNIHVNAVVFACEHTNVLEDIQFSDKPIESSGSVFVYYPQKGETVWKIAHRFNTTQKEIMRENGLEEDVIQTQMPLLIWK